MTTDRWILEIRQHRGYWWSFRDRDDWVRLGRIHVLADGIFSGGRVVDAATRGCRDDRDANFKLQQCQDLQPQRWKVVARGNKVGS